MREEVSLYNGHQKVVLEIDFSGIIFGYTELTIVPSSKDLKTIYLHSRQCNVSAVQVGGYPVQDWAYHDPLTNVFSSDITDCHKHPELKRKLYSAYSEADEGELAIPIPRQVSVKSAVQGTASGMVAASEAATPEPQASGQPLQSQSATPEFAPIQVRVTYSLRNPVDGVEFVRPSEAYPYRVPHVYTTPSSPDAARCWVPCIDNLWEKCTWEFEFVVPKSLEDDSDAMDIDGDDISDGAQYPTVVVCSGELVEKVAHPNNPNKVIFLFSQTVLTSVQHIGFAAGPFVVHSISAENAGLADDSAGSQTLMHAFCLPGYESFLQPTASFLRSAMNFYSTECGSYPFGSYKVVFVNELPTERVDSAGLSIAAADLLHGDDAIDQVFESRQVLNHGLACQWMGINIIPKAWSDIWLVNGLGLYIAGLFLRKIIGTNEYRFRMKRDMERVLDRDKGTMPPICQPHNFDPPDPAHLAFINLKAPLVLHLLDRRLGKSGTSLGLSRVLPKIFLSAISGEMPQNSLSTHSFLRTCRKVSGVDLRSFVEQWVQGSGCPQFSFLATFNRKKMAVEIQMRQECPAHLLYKDDPVALALFKPVPFFEGQMTVRIHEADGTPYEHVLDILTPTKRFEVPFNTKYKRVRRNTKRYLARQAAAQAAAEGDAEAAEAMGMIDMAFGLEVWEKEEERERWKVADWTEEEEQAMAGATYEWIRMDADFEWIARIQFEQADYMWVSQLQRDRDVVAQYEAVHALARYPTPIVSSTLTKTVLVSNYYFRVRCEAALALVTCATRRLDFIGLFHLLKLFLRYCYEPDDPNQDLFSNKFVPRPNDFSDLAEYFVRKALANAISQVRLENGKTPPVIRQFFIDQLRYNDNTTNSFTDAYYTCTLISSLACSLVSTVPPEKSELTKSEARVEQSTEDVQLLQASIVEIERYRSMDRLIPSVHNVVTVATLEFYMVLNMANLLPNDPKMFLTATREGNATQVRLAAFDGLFLTKWYTPKIMHYVFAVIANDPSRVVRRHVARSACESLAILATIGEIKHSSKDNESSLLIEEDGSVPDKNKETKKSDVDLVIRALRKDREIGKGEAVRDCLMPMLLDPKADYEVRWSLLKIADMLKRGAEEPLPKVTIHLPPTPAVEMPSPVLPTPTLKIAPKLSSQIKISNRKASIVLPPQVGATPTEQRTPSVTIQPLRKASAAITGAMAPGTPAAAMNGKAIAPKKKEKALPKSQAGGMSAVDYKACRSALKRLTSNKHAGFFLQPVDPIRDKAPNYFDIIKNPIDLSTMSARLEDGRYKDRSAFEADFRLMMENARTYNPSGTLVHSESLEFESTFNKLWARISNTVNAADKAAAQQQQQQQQQQLSQASTSAVPAPKPTPPVRPPTNHVQTSPSKPTPSIKTEPISASPAPLPKPPLLKLKLGGGGGGASASNQTHQQVVNGEGSSTTAAASVPTTPATKPKTSKQKKAKPVDMPPPPYIDDGSHDLLQEVIAMEEMEQKKSPAKPPTSKPSKLRKQVTLDDDELLSLAIDVPPKSSEPEPRASSEKRHLDNKPIPSPPPPRRGPPTQIRITRSEKPAERTATPPVPPPPAPSVKGKEKERPESSPAPTPKPKVLASPIKSVTPINEKKCREIIKNLLKIPQAIIFSRPVDPVLDGCPTYYDEIESPMDLATLKTRLDQGAYTTMEQFANNMELIFSNCRKFNPPTTDPVIWADIVEKAFRKEWAKAMEKKLSYQEKRSLQSIMTKLQQDIQWFVFREPVDPVLLGIPTYFDVIPRKDARDLRTIRGKLDADKYDSVESWEADMDLMIHNAIKFNGPSSEVGQIAYALDARVKDMIAPLRVATGAGASNASQSRGGSKRPAPGNSASSGSGGSSANGTNGVNGSSFSEAGPSSTGQPQTKKLRLTLG